MNDKQLEQYQKDKETLEVAQYIIDEDCTIRNASSNFMIPRATLHRRLINDLKHLDDDLYVQVRTILKRHQKESTSRMTKASLLKRKRRIK